MNSSRMPIMSGGPDYNTEKVEPETRHLREENRKLKNELQEVRSLYSQLVEETSHEKLDERRVNMLKSQVIQLERQVLLMSESLSSRSVVLQEVETALIWLADQCRSHITADIKGPEVPIPRSTLTEMVTKVESARIKLYKNIENTSKESLSKPLLFMNSFIGPGEQGQTTLFDICFGGMEHINLKQVSKLESKLCQLYRELVSVHEVMANGSQGGQLSSLLTGKATSERMSTLILKACARLDDCVGDLLSLSLLYPAAPWPPLRRPLCGNVTADRVVSCLPSLPRNKQQEVHRVVEALTKATNHRQYIKEQEIKALKEELNFHQAVYSLQNEYIGSLFEAVKCGYKDFEVNVEKWLCNPLLDILESYKGLKTSASEDGLRIFLKTFQDRADMLESTLRTLSTSSPDNSLQSSGVEGLSAFGEEFFTSLDKLCKDCQGKRDAMVDKNQTLKEQQENLDSTLQTLLEQRLVVKKAALEKERESKEPESSDRHDSTDGNVNRCSGKARQSLKQRPAFDLSISNVHSEFQKINVRDSTSSRFIQDQTKSSEEFDFVNQESSPASEQSYFHANSPKRPNSKDNNSYTSNRALHLRRSGSVSRLGQSRSPGGTAACNSEFPQTLQNGGSVNAVITDQADAISTKIHFGPPGKTSKKRLPTAKAPFR